VYYNFKEPEKIPEELHHTFDYVVVDPPFITDEVWELYAKAIRLLLIEGEDDEVCVCLSESMFCYSPTAFIRY